MKKRKRWKLPLLLAVCMAAFAVSLSVGSAQIGIWKSLRIVISHFPFVGKMVSTEDVSSMQDYILMNTRLPRVLLAFLVGGGLSVVGGIFQGIFRNPLADPHVLGVSSGAAMGATIAILTGISFRTAGMGAVSICAFIGASASIAVVYGVAGAGRGGKSSVLTILLTGTAISTFLSAVISFLMTLDQDGIEKVYLWTMGSFSSATWSKTAWTGGILACCLPVMIWYAGDLNLITMGDETAQSLGVEIKKVRLWLIGISSLAVAACVSSSGIISFVGLVVPHCMRFLFGNDYRILIWASFFGGGIFLLACDTAARTIMAPGEIPVGVVTAIIGAPYFIHLIRKNLAR